MSDDQIYKTPIPQGDRPNDQEPFTVNEIIGRSPGWILHSGMTVLFIVVVIGIAMTLLIRYPDKIQAMGVITTTDPYKPIVAKASGVVDTVFVTNNQMISIGAPILYIRNTADRNDVEMCMGQVEELSIKLSTHSLQRFLNNESNRYSLGPLQSTFASLDQQVEEFHHFLTRDDDVLK